MSVVARYRLFSPRFCWRKDLLPSVKLKQTKTATNLRSPFMRLASSAALQKETPIASFQQSSDDLSLRNRKQPDEPQTPSSAKSLPFVKWDERKVHVAWDPLQWSRYSNFWLRDHCRCPKCFHQVTKQRLLDTFDVPASIAATSVESTEEGLQITWQASEQHTSFYPWSWLKWNSHEPIQLTKEEQLPIQPTEKILWGSKIVQDPPTITHDYVVGEDKGLWKLLKKIDTFGFCFVSGVDATPEATEKLIRRIAFIRETHYGSFWDFTSDLAKGDTAYTTLPLAAHTDNTYFTDPCGLQIFHLLSHTEGSGGASLLVDGFYAASILKELHPKAYHTLSSVRVPTHAAGEAGELFRPSPSAGYPILNVDRETGKLVQVRYNNDDRSVMKRSVEELDEWYDALRLWDRTLKSTDSEYWVQLGPGTVVIIDNHRVLHGRSSFDGKRRMCGAYIGMDEFKSKLTVLSEKFSGEEIGRGETPVRSNWSPLF